MKKNLFLISILMFIIMSISIFATNYNYTKVVDSSSTINTFDVTLSDMIYTGQQDLIKRYTSQNLNSDLNMTILMNITTMSHSSVNEVIYCGETSGNNDCDYSDYELSQDINFVSSNYAIKSVKNSLFGTDFHAILDYNNEIQYTEQYSLIYVYSNCLDGLWSNYINYCMRTIGGYKYDYDGGQGGTNTNNNGIVYNTISNIDESGNFFACSNSSITKINLGSATSVYNTTNCKKLDYIYDSNTERYILAYVGFDNKLYLSNNLTSYNFQEQTQINNVKEIKINDYATYVLTSDNEIFRTDYTSTYAEQEVINISYPQVNPFTIFVNGTSNNSIFDIICNYTISNSDNTEYNFYRNNITTTILNMPFEVNTSRALYDYSDSFLTFQCGNSCPKWNSTGGHDGFGAYEYNATVGQSIYSNMTNEQLNLTSYSMFTWLNPKAYNFKQSYNDFSRLIIAGVNGVSYYQLASQTSTKMLYCRNQYNSTVADQVEYRIVGNFTPDTWYHVGCIDTGTELKIFIDGELKNTTIKTYPNRVIASNPTGNTITIGNIIPTGGSRVLNGSIDNIKIYNIGLSDRQAMNEYLENKKLSSEYFGNSDYKCSVYAFNSTNGTMSNETYSTNNVYVTQYARPNFNFNYPINNFHYMDFNGYVNLSITSNDLINNYNCQINDSRFSKISNSLFYNNTLENGIYNVSINCNDGYYNISKSIKFYIDDEVPFINNLDGLNPFTFVNEINTTFYVYDLFLYYINVSIYDTINNNVVYENVTYYNGTYINNVTLRVNPTLPDGNYSLRITVVDSLQNSPKIDDKSLITSEIKNDYSSSIDVNMYDSHIKKTITVYNKNNNPIKIKDLNFKYLNEWIDDGKHLKYLWNVDKSKLKYDDYFIITLSSNTLDNKMIYLSDRGRNRVIDSKNNLYFTFDDLVKNGYSVTYKQNINSVDVIVKQSLTEYNKKGSVVSYDPIVGGLNENTQEFNFTIDTVPPTINELTNAISRNNTIGTSQTGLSCTFYDLNGLASYGVSRNGALFYNVINLNFYSDVFSEQYWDIYCFATDNTGNYNKTPTVHYQPDFTAPRVTLTPITTQPYSFNYTFNYNIVEANQISKRLYIFKDNNNLVDINLTNNNDYYTLYNLSYGYYIFNVEVFDMFNKLNSSYLFYNMTYQPATLNESSININNIGNINNNTGTTCQDYNISFIIDNFDPHVNFAKYFGENPYNGIRVYEVTCPTIFNTTKTFQLDNFIRTSGVSILCNDYLAYQNNSFSSCTPRNLTLTLEIYDNVTNTNTSYEINISIVDKLNYTVSLINSTTENSRTDNSIYVSATSSSNETLNMTIYLYKGGVLYDTYTTNGSTIAYNFTNLPDGTYSYIVKQTDKYGDTTTVKENKVFIWLGELITDLSDKFTQTQVLFFGLMFFMYIGLLFVGFYLNVTPFQVLGLLFGVFLGILFFQIFSFVGIFFVLMNVSGIFFVIKK